jgi:hypothetical protein
MRGAKLTDIVNKIAKKLRIAPNAVLLALSQSEGVENESL